jgi:hypothetical protein
MRTFTRIRIATAISNCHFQKWPRSLSYSLGVVPQRTCSSTLTRGFKTEPTPTLTRFGEVQQR